MRWDEQGLGVFDTSGPDTEGDRTENSSEISQPLASHTDETGKPTRRTARPDDSTTDEERRRTVAQYLRETFGQAFDWQRIDPRKSVAGNTILTSSPEQRREFVRQIVQRMTDRAGCSSTEQLQGLLAYILRQRNTWDEGILRDLVVRLADYQGRDIWSLPSANIVRLVENFLTTSELTPELRQALEDLRRLYKVRAVHAEERAIFRRLDQLLRQKPTVDEPITFDTGEAWTKALADGINAQPTQRRPSWRLLLEHAAIAKNPAPRPVWLKRAATLLETVGTDEFIRVIQPCLAAVGLPRDSGRSRASFQHRADPTQIHEQYSDLLRGLTWFAAATASPAMIPLLGSTAERCFERLPRKQPRSLKVAVACIHTLTMYENAGALQELIRLQSRARQPSIKSRLLSAVSQLRQCVDLPAHELEELSVPDLELDGFGQLHRQIGKYTATISIRSPGIVTHTYEKEGGEPQYSTPHAIKAYYASEAKWVQKRSQEISAELPGQKLRLERLLVSNANWSLADFRRHYLDHLLVGPLARCLIWRFETDGRTIEAIWRDGCLRNLQDEPVVGLADATRVTTWHPLSSDSDCVDAWQEYVENNNICQPFKQAHREIYRRLPDESRDAIVSDRFSGRYGEPFRLEHVATVRNWQLTHKEPLEDLHSPYWDLPEWGLRAVWTTLPIAQWIRANTVMEPNLKGVTFFDLSSGQPVPVQQIPEIVFSEVLREVDCYFLQYGSEENFNNFYRLCQDESLREHWLQFALGPLTAQGQVRKSLLQRILPASTLADRCHIQDEYLCVQGDVDEYRIHLTSGTVRTASTNEIVFPRGYVFTAHHTGLPPGNEFPQLPFGGDVRLACILRNAKSFLHDSNLDYPRCLILGRSSS